MKLLKIGTTDFLSSVILSTPNIVRRVITIMTKGKVILILIGAIVFSVGYSLGSVIRDAKMLSTPPQSEGPIYQRIQVIPFTN